MFQLLIVPANYVYDDSANDGDSFQRGCRFHESSPLQFFSKTIEPFYMLLKEYLKQFEFFQQESEFDEEFPDKKSVVTKQFEVDLFTKVFVVISEMDDKIFNLGRCFNFLAFAQTEEDFVCTKIPYEVCLQMDKKEIDAFVAEHQEEYNEWKYSVDYSTAPVYYLRNVYCANTASQKIIENMWDEWLKTDSRKRRPVIG